MKKGNKEYFESSEKAEAFNEAFLSFSKIDTNNAQLPPFHFKTDGRRTDIQVTEKEVKSIQKDLND